MCPRAVPLRATWENPRRGGRASTDVTPIGHKRRVRFKFEQEQMLLGPLSTVTDKGKVSDN